MGAERQNYPLSDMIMPPVELVSRISRDMSLLPGDVIACGTSVGVGSIKDGATVEVEITGIGVLTNAHAAGDKGGSRRLMLEYPRDGTAAALLERMFRAAIASAQPAVCVPPHLPEPPRGRLMVIGAGKGLGGHGAGRGGPLVRSALRAWSSPAMVMRSLVNASR